MLSGPVMVAAPPEPGPAFTLQQVAPGVYAALDIEARAGANAGFVIVGFMAEELAGTKRLPPLQPGSEW